MEVLLRRRGACLVLVGVLSLLVHSKGLRAPLLDYHYHRQVNTASIARNYWREARPLLKPRVDWEGPEERLAATELPVYMWLCGKLWPVLGESAGRALSVIASLLTALLLFLLFEREFGRESALYGACLFSLIPLEVYFGRTVQPEATALLGVAAALYFWERSLEPERPAWAWAAATLATFIAVGLKMPYAHVFIPLAALTWRRLGLAGLRDARLWAAGLLAAGGAAAWYVYASSGVYVVPTHSREFLVILGWNRLPYYAQFLLTSRFLELVTTYGGMVLFLAGAREIFVRRREPFWMAWFGGVIFHLLALGAYAHGHEYTALPLAPVAAGLMGTGLRLLLDKARAAVPSRRAAALAAVALLTIAVPIHTVLRIGHWYRQGFGYFAAAGRAAAAVSAPSDPFMTNCQAPSLLLYYLDRRGWSYEFEAQPERAEANLAAAEVKGARFIASEKRGLFAEPDGALWRTLNARGAPVWDDGKLVIFPLGKVMRRRQ